MKISALAIALALMPVSLGCLQAGTIELNGGFTPAPGTGAPADWSYSGAINLLYAVSSSNAVNGVQNSAGLWNASNGGTGDFTAPYAGASYVYGQDAWVYPNYATTKLSGLTVNDTYSLNFFYAAGQQTPYTSSSAFTVGWNYYVGAFNSPWTNGCSVVACPAGPVLGSVQLDVQSKQFTGWYEKSTTFIANAATETLGFVSYSNAGDVPPFALLAGVTVADATVAAVPEPSTWALLLTGFGAVAFAGYRRRKHVPLCA
jgi:hypothetical protein